MQAMGSSATSRSSHPSQNIPVPISHRGTSPSRPSLRSITVVMRRRPRHKAPTANGLRRGRTMNSLMRTWAAGGTTLGAWTTLNTPVIAELLATIGHDYVCLDQQHGVADDVSLLGSLIAVAVGGAAPLVRVPANEPSMISKALDCGAAGVVIPLVNDRSDAERAVQSCKYPPEGDRSIGPIRTSYVGGGRTADNVACIVMVESASAVNNIDEICSVPGVDAVYVGPADLAASLGCPPTLGIGPGVHAEAIAT